MGPCIKRMERIQVRPVPSLGADYPQIKIIPDCERLDTTGLEGKAAVANSVKAGIQPISIVVSTGPGSERHRGLDTIPWAALPPLFTLFVIPSQLVSFIGDKPKWHLSGIPDKYPAMH